MSETSHLCSLCMWNTQQNKQQQTIIPTSHHPISSDSRILILIHHPLIHREFHWIGWREPLQESIGSAHQLPSGNLTLLWKITMFNGKIHYKWPFSIATVKLPEGSDYKVFPYFFLQPIQWINLFDTVSPQKCPCPATVSSEPKLSRWHREFSSPSVQLSCNICNEVRRKLWKSLRIPRNRWLRMMSEAQSPVWNSTLHTHSLSDSCVQCGVA